MGKIAILILMLCSIVAAEAQPGDSQASRVKFNASVTTAISRGVYYLQSRQKADGSWADDQETDRDGGQTALVTLALLSAGVPHTSPTIDRAVKFLKKAPTQKTVNATYSTGLRAALYAELPEALRKSELPADLRWLQAELIRTGDRKGMYDYNEKPSLGGDFSNSQYGVLGVWYGALAGVEVPRSYWKSVEDAWRNGQTDDGGWGYMPGTKSYASMTAAGAATLFITNDFLHTGESEDLLKPQENAPLEAAVKWLGENFSVDQNAGKDFDIGRGRPAGFRDRGGRLRAATGNYIHYMLFGFERVGELSGLTQFGGHRWFDEGSGYLIDTQSDDGSWTGTISSECDTAYALLFLSRGQSPIVLQKLEFGERWDNRPRDASGFTHFMRRATERHVNWQIVSIDDSPADLRQSPLLYAASDKALRLNVDQIQKIKDYLDQGGLLVCCNEGRGNEFASSMEAFGKSLFTKYSFRDLPKDHPIYTANFPVTLPTTPIRAMSNGLRELMVIYPKEDLSWRWQRENGAFDPRHTPYASLANLHLYVTDRANPRLKGEDSWIERNDDGKLSKTVRVVRIPYDGNWDPEPGGWKRLANQLANANRLDLQTDDQLNFTGAAFAHLTGTTTIKLNPAVQNLLRDYCAAGGLLLCDAAGGSSEAGSAAEAAMHELFPNAEIDPLPVDHPIYHQAAHGGVEIKAVKYRRSPNLAPSNLPRLKQVTLDGKLIAILSEEDLSGGLVGYTTAGLNGYTPQSATEIVSNLVLWRTSKL